MDTLRFAIIGCGRMGLIRAKAIKALGAKIYYSVDTDFTRAKQIADMDASCKALGTYEDIDWTQIDGVFICTPPGIRGPVELMAAHYDLGVFAEKPLHLSATGASALGQAFAHGKGLFAVGYMNRHRSSVVRVKEELKELNIIGYQCHWICKPYSVTWWNKALLSGGALNEQMTHSVDLCRYLFGDVKSVFARIFSSPTAPHIQSVCAALEHANVAGSILYSCAGQDKDIGLHIFTNKGPIVFSGWDYSLINAPWMDGENEPNDLQDVFQKETESFLKALKAGDKRLLKCSLEDGISTQLTVDAIRKSDADQCLIRL